MIIDTHCHLDFAEFSADIDAVLDRARISGVTHVINVASNVSGCRGGLALASEKDNVYCTLGVHPHHASETSPEELDGVEGLYAPGKKIVAVGEIGLDYYRNLSPRADQITLFKRFLGLAKKWQLPVVVHSRDAKDDTYDILKSELGAAALGVIHCYSYDTEFLGKVLDMGFCVSFTSNVTYKNTDMIKEAVKYTPMDRIMLETDAPYLSPQPFRGKRNEPSFLTYLRDAVAVIKGVSPGEVEAATTRNANLLFKLGLEV